MKSEIYMHKIGQCENLEQYEELVQENRALYVGWSEHVLPMLTKCGIGPEELAHGCGVNKKTAEGFCEKIPTKRKNVIMMAMMMHLSVEETNDLLMRWAKFQRLYSRHPEDAIWIYLLQKGGSNQPKKLFQTYYAQYEKMREIYLASEMQKSSNPMETGVVFNHIITSARKEKTAVENDEEFNTMMRQIIPSFEESYQKLLDYIDVFFTDIEVDQCDRLGLEKQRTKHLNGKIRPNDLLENNPSFRSIYYPKMSKLKKNREMPSRLFLIALGIHLSMDTDQLNTMLELAGMGPLCPKDKLESAIVFFLEELYCECPACFYQPKQLRVDPAYKELQNTFDADRGTYDMLILLDDEDDVPDEKLSDYLKRRLEEAGIVEEGEKGYLKFLKML